MKPRWIGQSEDGLTVTLKKMSHELFSFPLQPDPALIRTGIVLDVETTGLNHETDQIIELAFRMFTFNRESGEVLSLGESFSSFQDPGVPLSPEISALTGITDVQVKGQQIDWKKVDLLLSQAQVIIAHNAAFDRPFVDQKSEASRTIIWGCSLHQVDWEQWHFPSHKLEVLSIYHGFFNDAHRALSDVDSLLYLLSLPNPQSQPYLKELLQAAKTTQVQVLALHAPFECKDLLKQRGYRWDTNGRVWSTFVSLADQDAEVQWLEESIYRGAFRGKLLEIKPVDRFK